MTFVPPSSPYSKPLVTPIGNSTISNTGAALTFTLPGVTGQTTYITGFDFTSGSSTAGGTSTITVTGTTNALNWCVPITASDTVAGNGILEVRLPDPMPATASNSAITISSSSIAAASFVALTAYGFQAPLAAGQT